MPTHDTDLSLRVAVDDPQGRPLGGTVDLQLKPRTPGETIKLKGRSAAKEIDVKGLERGAVYELTVTPTDVGKPVSQEVSIPARGFAKVKVVIDKGTHVASHTLGGNLVFDHGLLAAGVTVRLYSVGFGGKDTLAGEVQSDATGKYSFNYSHTSTAAQNLQVRAIDPAGKEVTISATKFNATPAETLNLVVPASVQPLAPEFQRLSADMQKSIGDIGNLGQAQEGTVRQDLTLLNQSTSWDARLVALAATAAQNIATTGLGQDILYALWSNRP
jgi:hypothetical protein